MTINILMITHNRLAYTEQSLPRLLDSVPNNTKITVWDNFSNLHLTKFLKKFEKHPKIARIIYHNSNDLLNLPTNWFWKNHSDSHFLGKVDDDCIMPDGWVDVLLDAHIAEPKLGIIGCWHFLLEDFNYEISKKKIFPYNNHNILRNCWVGGSGYLMKSSIVEKVGLLKSHDSFTRYCIRAASLGYINGWYYPLIFQKHLDDPRVKLSGINSNKDFFNSSPLSANTFQISNVNKWEEHLKNSALRLQLYSYNPKDFLALRARLLRKLYKIFGFRYIPTV